MTSIITASNRSIHIYEFLYTRSTFLSKLSDEEQHRYEAFRRAHLTKTTVKRVITTHASKEVPGADTFLAWFSRFVHGYTRETFSWCSPSSATE